MSDYDEDTVLFQHVLRFCHDLMTELERRAERALLARAKAVAVTNRSLAKVTLDRWGEMDDSEVNALLADGAEAFRKRVCQRIISDPTFQAAINRCPKCNRIVRTQTAKQCMWCKHDWH